jgi:hypothetical protein
MNVNYNPISHNQNDNSMGQYYHNQVNNNNNFNMKDYSKDLNINGWSQTNGKGQQIEMGAVAMQAQGYSVPAR